MVARPKFANLIIKASAGSGKTFQLSNRYLALLAEGVSPESILATTFTRKAAGEITLRIVQRLLQASLSPENAIELGKQIDKTDFTDTTAQQLLARVLANLHALQISTLDSHFAKLAKTFSLELGIPPGWDMLSNAAIESLQSRSIRKLLLKGQAFSLLNLMTKGETVRSVGQTLTDTVDDLYWLYLDSEGDAWRHIAASAPSDPSDISEALNDLSKQASGASRIQKAIPAELERFQSEDWDQFLAKGLAAKVASGDHTYYKQPIDDAVVLPLAKLIRHAESQILLRIRTQTENAYRLVEQFHEVLKEAKQQIGRFSFDDVSRTLAKNIDKLPGELTSFRMGGTYEHLLLDEFQDTSPLQWRVLFPTAKRTTSGDPNRSFFCVGDVKQAIYGFRGGSAEIFDSLPKELSNLGTPKTLSQSYRSSPFVLDFVNLVFKNLTKHPKLEHYEDAVAKWERNFPDHTSAKPSLPGYACVEALADEDEALDAIVERVADFHRRAPDKSIAILVRTNREVAQFILRLGRAGVAASEEGGVPLTDAAAVHLIISALHLADHPGDSVARFHLSFSPLGGFLGFAPESKEKQNLNALQAHRAALNIRHEIAENGYGKTIDRWSHILAPSSSPREFRRLMQLVDAAYAYDKEPTLRTRDFISHIRSEKMEDPSVATIRVMTIHQAKGLEFDAVFVPVLDKTGGLVGQPPTFVAHRDTPTGPITGICRYTNKDNLRILPRKVQKWFEEHSNQRVTESLALLYVALTRSVHHLQVFVTALESGNPPKNEAGLICSALKECYPTEATESFFAIGAPRWFESIEAKPTPTDESPKQILTIEESPLRFRPRSRKLSRFVRFSSPSRLEGGERFAASSLLEVRPNQALQRGTLFHAWFEQVKWLENAPLEEKLRQIGWQHLHDEKSIESELNIFQKLLNQPQIRSLLLKESYRKNLLSIAQAVGFDDARIQLSVETEKRFGMVRESDIMHGSIDRLVIVRDGRKAVWAEIIDYKTDYFGKDWKSSLEERVLFYSPQLQAYRQAVSELLRLPTQHVQSRLAFVFHDYLVSIG